MDSKHETPHPSAQLSPRETVHKLSVPFPFQEKGISQSLVTMSDLLRRLLGLLMFSVSKLQNKKPVDSSIPNCLNLE